MRITDQIAALFEDLRIADLEAMRPAERRRFVNRCRHWAQLAEPRDNSVPNTGVLRDLKSCSRSE